ncbi:hypothetical protein KC351_g107 [Hortaea werneckii]|nr:hypothetical protein KC351_g107 [Hortaea werneckii]
MSSSASLSSSAASSRSCHDTDCFGIVPDLTLPEFACELGRPETFRRRWVRCDEVMASGLHATVELVVRGLRIGSALLLGVEISRGHSVLRRVWLSIMSLRRNRTRLPTILSRSSGSSVACDFWVAIGNVADEVNQIAEANNAGIVGGGGRLQEELVKRCILRVLADEIVTVGGRVDTDFVLKIRQIGVDLLERANFALHLDGRLCPRSLHLRAKSAIQHLTRSSIDKTGSSAKIIKTVTMLGGLASIYVYPIDSLQMINASLLLRSAGHATM